MRTRTGYLKTGPAQKQRVRVQIVLVRI